VYDRYEPESEAVFNLPEDSVWYFYYLETQEKPKAQSRKKASSRTGNSARPRKGVHKQVLQCIIDETSDGDFDWAALSRLRKEGKY
jgi:hypothetical protein